MRTLHSNKAKAFPHFFRLQTSCSILRPKSIPMQKSILLIFTALLCVFTSQAQVLTTTPTFPKDNSDMSIIIDCSKGNQGLFNYSNTNDVYVHVGVITNLSTSPADWKYVKFTWGTTDANAKATSLGNNRYQYTITNIRAFFGVPASETIRKVTFLLRNGAGTSVHRNSDGSDMYISIYSDAFAGKFLKPALEPRFTPVVEPFNLFIGDTMRVTWAANAVADLKLFFNGNQINSVSSSNAIVDSFKINSYGNQQLVGRGTSGATTISDTLNFYVPPATTVSPLPAGVRDGINYEPGDTSVTLVLYAPNKTRVSVIGEFNNWIESPESQMFLSTDGKRFWKRITGLTKGTEYSFQYLVDGTIRIGDPYTEKVLDPNNDAAIGSNLYPNLKSYPYGKTTGIVSVLQTAKPRYTWQVPSFTRPDKSSLVVYELLLRDFVFTHDWKTVKDSINYFKHLGVNAIELMPFNEFEGNNSWGYNPSYYLAPDKYYGTDTKLKEFIDECHKNGIAVIMDIALNHSFGQSPMVQLYFDNANNRPASNSPWFNPVPRHAFNVGYDMNHESDATKYFVSRVVEHWLKEYKLDGFRFDLSKGFTQNITCDGNGNNCNVGSWSNYDASRINIWKAYYDTLQLKSPGSYVILEHFADNSEEKVLSDYGMMLWGNMNYNFNEATMGYIGNSNFAGALHTERGWSKPNLVSYMESHDEERLMYKNINFAATTPTYDIRNISIGLKRNAMAASFLFMMPGPKMIWQFGELGFDYSINTCQNGSVNSNCRLDIKPLVWDYLQEPNRKVLYEVYSGLLQLRQNPLFKAAFSTNRVEHSLGVATKWLKLTTDTSNILVVGNFDLSNSSINVTFQNAGTWYDYFTGGTIAATGSQQTINLQPGEYHVYVNRNVTYPLSAVTPVIDIPFNEKKLSLSVFPNPVQQQATIQYELPESGTAQLKLYNITGQQVAVLVNKFQPQGLHTITVNQLQSLYKLRAGTYFLQMEFGGKRLVQKLVLQF